MFNVDFLAQLLKELERRIKLLESSKNNNSALRAYPIGSIFFSANPINPSQFIGGDWEKWGSGKTIVGVDENQTEFNISEKTGGEKKHTLIENEIPEHDHKLRGRFAGGSLNGPGLIVSNGTAITQTSGPCNNVTLAMDKSGENQAHNNLQPYITCYMWKRIN